MSDIDEEDGDDNESEDDVESDGENSSPSDPILRKPQGQIAGIALVIVPRRLSTISSRDTLSIRSREENDQLLNEYGGGFSGRSLVNSNNNFNPSTISSPGPSNSTDGGFTITNNSNNGQPTLLLPAGFGRRKMSEQPVQFFVVPASSGLLNSGKWHSMSSVESGSQSNQPQLVQAHFISTSPTQSRSHSRSQSPMAFRANTTGKHDGQQRMTSMAENQEESLLDRDSQSPPSDSFHVTDSGPRNFGYRDPTERRVSFQLPAVTVAMSGEVDDAGNDPPQSSQV